MNTLTHILPRVGAVDFTIAPQYGQPQLVEMPTQRNGRDSNGDQYCYQGGSGVRILHRLAWSTLGKTVLDDLLLFHQTAQGCKHYFRWMDHLGAEHAVCFPREPIKWKQTGPDRYNISIGLEESIGLAQIDENNQALLDENGNVITW